MPRSGIQAANGEPAGKYPAAIVGLLILVSVVAFLPALRGEFLNWDDDRNFVENETFRGVGLEQLRWAWSTYHLGVWQPLAWILLGVEYGLFGLRPAGYHAFSIGIHACNAVLVYMIARRVLTRCRAGPARNVEIAASAAALLFAVHPLRVEAVAWISCQPYLPAIACYLLAVWVYLRARWERPAGTLIVAFGLYLAAIGFKAVAVSLPAILLLLDWYPLGRMRARRDVLRCIAEKAPFLVVAFFSSCWAMRAKDFTNSREPFHEMYPIERLSHAALAIWFYLGKTLWPSRLIAFYRLPEDMTHLSTGPAIAGIAIVAVTVGLWAIRGRTKAPLAAWLSYLIVLLPNAGLIQISRQLAADRYGYLALVGPMILLGAGIAWVTSRASRPLLETVGPGAIIAVLAVALLVRAREQCLMWGDSVTLWKATLDVDPDCAVACCNMGEALVKRREFGEASKHLSRAIEIDSRFAFAYANLGVILCQARRFQEAADFGEQAVAIPDGLKGIDLARAHAMLGEAYAGLRRDREAWRHTRIARDMGLVEAQKMIDYLSRFSKENGQSQ
ncbi:MAG TPA: tetratricopeptide repeat protein [Phycisphaerae bacterium]|nr:tetratricopeptide repeat protein [Phycisphaerae bacterium]